VFTGDLRLISSLRTDLSMQVQIDLDLVRYGRISVQTRLVSSLIIPVLLTCLPITQSETIMNRLRISTAKEMSAPIKLHRFTSRVPQTCNHMHVNKSIQKSSAFVKAKSIAYRQIAILGHEILDMPNIDCISR